MIKWENEMASKNYCGYCFDVTCVCNGGCFTNDRIPEDIRNKNKLDHLNVEIELTNKRLTELEEEKRKLVK